MSVTPIISDASQDHSFDLRREIALDAPCKLRGAHTKNKHSVAKCLRRATSCDHLVAQATECLCATLAVSMKYRCLRGAHDFP